MRQITASNSIPEHIPTRHFLLPLAHFSKPTSDKQSSTIKISLGTRSPGLAQHLSRLLEPLLRNLLSCYGDGTEYGLVERFCELRGIGQDLPDSQRDQLQIELRKGYQSFIDRALDLNGSFDGYALDLGNDQPNTAD